MDKLEQFWKRDTIKSINIMGYLAILRHHRRPRKEKPDNAQTTKSRSVPYHFKDIFKPLLINYKVSTLLRKVAQPNDFKTRDMKLVDDN